MAPAAPSRPPHRSRPGRRPRSPRALLGGCIATLALAACTTGAVQGSPRDAPDRRAALATLVVDNRTSRTLVISFRYAFAQAAPVQVGRVAPGRLVEVAPVPAQEPIILSAHGSGLERELEPRILQIDAMWTWVITDSVPDGF